MPTQHIDLSYLERLYKGDRLRMEHWVRIYLEESPEHFRRLQDCLRLGDAEGLAMTAHDIRPLAHYLGAQGMVASLIRIGQEARTSGAAACAATVEDLLVMGSAAEAELRTAFSLV